MVVILVSIEVTLAQPYVREVENIPVTVNSQPVSLPWAGGINSPHFQFVDIDGDMDKDLFIVDHDNNGVPQINFYRNEGTPTSPDFHLRSSPYNLPSLTFWFLFVDITGDGLNDLFTDDGSTGMNYYMNQGTPQAPQFVLIEASMRDSVGNPINAGSYSVPAFADIDGDDRIDFFSGNIIGSLNFYRNIGTPSNPLFRFITDFWEDLFVISGGTCCPSFSVSQNVDPRGTRFGKVLHGANAIFFSDIDNDNDFDLFWGDLFHTGLFFFRNQGTPQNPVMVLVDTCFPSNDPVCTLGGNQPGLVDIDSDGDRDFFVGVGVVSGAIVQRHGFLFYENVGTPSSPSFVKRTEDYLSLVDVGREAHPKFADIDADGKSDMFVGTTNGEIWYFRNTGTLQSPSFQLVDTSFAGISGGYTYASAFVDIDADGDYDLFLGLFNGTMRYYQNDGTPSIPQFVQVPSPVDTINVTYNNAPTFIDIDNDGDFDLFVGGNNGRLRFYRNTGSAANFVPMLESATYQDIIAGQNSRPYFVDINGDGDVDLFIGTSEGRVEFFENIGTPQNAQFLRITNHYANTDPMQEAAPVFVDIDGDGDVDLFVGTLTGGIHLYRNDFITSVAEQPGSPAGFGLRQNYPNPFNPTTLIRYTVAGEGIVTIKVYDIVGREVAVVMNGKVPVGTYEVLFNAPQTLTSGVYLYRLSFVPSNSNHQRYQESRKLVLLR